MSELQLMSGVHETRQARAEALATTFPKAAERGAQLSSTVGGRSIALPVLGRLQPSEYARTRNHLDGAVTRLSAYVRHGAITLGEMYRAALGNVRQPAQAEKFVSELGWRDYYQRVYEVVGNRLWNDLEYPKTGYAPGDYKRELPADVQEGKTGLACMDGFADELRQTGYLHNHARMWMAAYVVHHRRVHWRAGAEWFLQHLLDGDVASNNLSWQWVASTFSAKPYYFDRGNLEGYTGGRYCGDCAARKACPFGGGYEHLARKLFRPERVEQGALEQPTRLAAEFEDESAKPVSRDEQALAWVHDYALGDTNPALQAAGTAAFVWDPKLYGQGDFSLKRLVFISECLGELPTVQQYVGETVETLRAAARQLDKRRIVTTYSASPYVKQVVAKLGEAMPVEVVQHDPLVRLSGRVDVTRFTRYWKKAEARLVREPVEPRLFE